MCEGLSSDHGGREGVTQSGGPFHIGHKFQSSKLKAKAWSSAGNVTRTTLEGARLPEVSPVSVNILGNVQGVGRVVGPY